VPSRHAFLAVNVLCFSGLNAFGQIGQAQQSQASGVLVKISTVDIQKLVDQLGSNIYVERKDAANRLAAIGEPAWNALRKAATTSEDLEVRRSAARLADEIGRKRFVEVRLLDRLGELLGDQPGREDVSKAFWHACSGAQRRAAEYLLSRGADLNWAPDYAKGTPLDAARADGTRRENVVRWLQDHGALSSVSGVEEKWSRAD
jgi:hypothetical protein